MDLSSIFTTVRSKSEAIEKFREYKAKVENLTGKKSKFLQSDKGGE